MCKPHQSAGVLHICTQFFPALPVWFLWDLQGCKTLTSLCHSRSPSPNTMSILVPTVANCVWDFVWLMVSHEDDTARCLDVRRLFPNVSAYEVSLFFFLLVNHIFLVVTSSLLPDFLRTGLLPFFFTQSYTHCDFWQPLWNMKSCHRLSWVGPGRPGSLTMCQGDISSFKSCSVSPMALRGLSMPAFSLSSFSGSYD